LTEETRGEDVDARRQEAVAAFNRAWELIDSPQRSNDDDAEMLTSAFVSRYLWDSIGGDEQRAVGDWQIAHVASLLGHSELALSFASRALGRVLRNGWTDWRLASCYEGMARAQASAGNDRERDRWVGLAREALAGIDDEEDRDLIASQLASVGGTTTTPAVDGELAGDRGYRVAHLDHVQLAMPPGLEADAEAFYGEILGLETVAKPAALAAHGGRWFVNENVAIHLGLRPSSGLP